MKDNDIDTEYYGSSLKILGEYNGCTIFFGRCGFASPLEISRYLDGYIIQSYNIEYPYDLGLYACKGGTVYTLAQAVEQKLFKISDIADLLNRDFSDRAVSIGKMKGDINQDNKINLQDVVTTQRAMANLISFNAFQTALADLNGNEKADMDDVVMMQQYVAGLINSFPSSNA